MEKTYRKRRTIGCIAAVRFKGGESVFGSDKEEDDEKTKVQV